VLAFLFVNPLDRFDIRGKSALVVGATGALGRTAAQTLSGMGARITIASGNLVELDAVAAQTGAANIVNRRPETAEDADAMVEACGRIDIVVVASGLNIVAMAPELDPDDWAKVMDANVRGSWLVARAAGKRMIAQGDGGKIVLVSSTRGKLGHPMGYSAYCPSKAAVDGLVRSLACEWGQHGINVNGIGPTVFRSKLTEWMFGEDEKASAFRKGVLSRIPLGRLGEPDDLAGVLAFLVSPASDFCTGQILYVDGGYTAG